MIEYHKIQSIYKRDEHGRFMCDQWSTPELEYLSGLAWDWTEKVDGTNIRIWVGEDRTYHVGGRTDNAQLHAGLLDGIAKLELNTRLGDLFPDSPVCLYGEGYGAGIQKGGGNYRQDKSFVLFDVLVGKTWLLHEGVVQVGASLGVDVVPYLGRGTLLQAEDIVRRGLKSQWGDFDAEGIVARPKVPMWDRRGNRVITKVKGRDFLQ